MNCINCGGKPYAEDAIGLPYCKNCVADHDSFARRTLVGGYDPQSRERVAWASNPNTAPQGRVRGSNRVEYINKNRTGEKVSELRKKFERAEGKRKKKAILAEHEAKSAKRISEIGKQAYYEEEKDKEMSRYAQDKQESQDAQEEIEKGW